MNNTVIRDLYAETTARIVAALEQGTAPWVKPWSTGIDTLPMNGGTRHPYRGVNVLLLELEATAHGYPLQRWLTYRQAQELGGQVRKGEHGTTVVFWHLHQREVGTEADHDEVEPKMRVVLSLPKIRLSKGASRDIRGSQAPPFMESSRWMSSAWTYRSSRTPSSLTRTRWIRESSWSRPRVSPSFRYRPRTK